MKDKLITELYNSIELNNILKNITKGHYLTDDLKSELFYILLKMPYEKLAIAKEQGYLMYLCINILKKQYNSSTSPFHRKYRALNNFSELESTEDKEELREPYLEFEEFIMNEIHTVLKSCDYIDRELFKLYYKLDEYDRWIGEKRDTNCTKNISSTRKIEKKLAIQSLKGQRRLTIDHSTIAKSIKRTKLKIIKHLKNKDIDYEF